MSEGKVWRQERPTFCPHPSCQFVRRVTDTLCGGKLPEPVEHEGDFNTHRICLNGMADDGGVFDLQINKTDINWFKMVVQCSAYGGRVMPEKVYCIKCEHYCGSLSPHDECTAEIVKEWDTYFKRYTRFANPKKKNKKNDCRDFKRRDPRR